MGLVLDSILQRLALALDELMPHGRVLAAVSGGADSLALLQVLVASGRQVLVAHINHGLRAGESDADQEFVRDLCKRLEIPLETRHVQVLARGNIEARAREARYNALGEMARSHGCRFVATGHTASDNLETILLFWLRGATISGLRGIEPSRPLPALQVLEGGSQAQQVLVVRPILDLSRAECEAICREANLEWRVDSSNASPKYLRNRVRRELVPLLADLIARAAPGGDAQGSRERLARQALRASRLWADDVDLLDAMANRELESLVVRRESDATKYLVVLDGERLGLLHPAMQRRVLRLAALEVGEVSEISSRKIEASRLWILGGKRRAVWQWSRRLQVEWCGSGSGNRVRLLRVEVGDADSFK